MNRQPDPPLLAPEDQAVIAGQLGRRPRDVTRVPVRCSHGFPAVIETAPVLSDGSPNPTLLYLTCPALTARISGLEAGGAVREFKRACSADPALRKTVEEVAGLYRARRAQLACGKEALARLEAGIGGPPGPHRATCLHAHAAALLAAKSGALAADDDLVQRVEQVWAALYPGLEDPWCDDRRCVRWSGPHRRAVIDAGTISVRLLVADISGVSVVDVARRAEITRLGEGLRPGGELAAAARTRTADMVRRFVAEARSLDAGDIMLLGTSATRDAADGTRFIKGLGKELRISSRVLSGAEEAALAYGGAALETPPMSVVVDVGGGSTELIRMTGTGALDLVSLPLGASRASEAWVKTDPPAGGEVAAILDEARGMLEPLRSRFAKTSQTDAGSTSSLVGVAGTVTTLACLDAGLTEYDRTAIHLRRLSVAGIRRLLIDLAAMTVEQRSALPCVQAGRAPVIVAGAAVLLSVLEALGYDELIVSERDLLDGSAVHGPW